MNAPALRFDRWLHDAEQRHLADLTFPQVSSGLRALSSTYVERRRRIAAGGTLDGAGKRAAFALFYAPLHFMTVSRIVDSLSAAEPRDGGTAAATLVDLGCGTGAAGAAWGSALRAAPHVVGVDRHSWALAEAARTYRQFGLKARNIRADFTAAALPRGGAAIVAAYAVNELSEEQREALLYRLEGRVAAGDRLLVVEPIAGFVSRWWDLWRERLRPLGCRADEWRFRVELPPIVAKLDRAARLDHRELTARSLWCDGAGRF